MSVFQEYLRAALRDAILGKSQRGSSKKTLTTFDRRQFFASLYRERGSAWFFLFKKNARVTNLGFAELLSLVRAELRSQEKPTRVANVRFLTNRELTDAVERLVRSFEGEPINKVVELVVNLYGPLIRETVVVRPYRGSCIVFLPPTLSIDIKAVTVYAGYVHSSGPLIYAMLCTEPAAKGTAMYAGFMRAQPAISGEARSR